MLFTIRKKLRNTFTTNKIKCNLVEFIDRKGFKSNLIQYIISTQEDICNFFL